MLHLLLIIAFIGLQPKIASASAPLQTKRDTVINKQAQKVKPYPPANPGQPRPDRIDPSLDTGKTKVMPDRQTPKPNLPNNLDGEQHDKLREPNHTDSIKSNPRR